MFQNNFYISLRKTQKINIDENAHELPPDDGPFDEYQVAEYPGCPSEWSKDGIFVAVDEKQPIWFDFRGNIEAACLASIQRINPVTGEPANLEGGLSKDPQQNYMKLPDQLWLDGYSKDGKVYQFVVVTEGEGVAVNEVILPKHMQDSHAIGFAFYLPKLQNVRHEYNYLRSNNWNQNNNHINVVSNNVVSNKAAQIFCSTSNRQFGGDCSGLAPNDCLGESHGLAPTYDYDRANELKAQADVLDMAFASSESDVDASMLDQASMGAGGRIRQDIVCDNNTTDYYQEKPVALLNIYLALPEMFKTIMKQGKKQNADKKDRFKMSGIIADIPVPLV